MRNNDFLTIKWFSRILFFFKESKKEVNEKYDLGKAMMYGIELKFFA